MNTTLIVTGIAAAVVLAAIAAWRSVARKKIDSGGTFTWTLLTLRWVVPVPAPEYAPAASEQTALEPIWRATS